MPAIETTDLFDACLKAYGITDFQTQIVRYPETFASYVQSRLMPKGEFERSLSEGFYFGHKTAGLGEFLSFSALPRLIKKHYPMAKVFVGPNRFAEAIFKNDPHVDAIGERKDRLPFGSQKEFGFGTTTNRRLLPMGIFSARPLGPEMTLSPESVTKAQEWREKLKLGKRKLIFIQSSGRTNPKVFSAFKWSHWIWKLRGEFCFVQIGNLRDQFIWAEHIMLKQWRIDEMAALLSVGDAFVGPNSGVMHLASAVRARTVVMHNEAKASEIVFPVLADNASLPGRVNHHLFHCYPWHYHLVVDELFDERSRFAEQASFENFKAILREACVQPNPHWMMMKSHFDKDSRQIL